MKKIILNNFKTLLIIAFGAIIICSCAEGIEDKSLGFGFTNDLFYLRQGMSYSKLDSMFEINKKIGTFEIKIVNNKYNVVMPQIASFYSGYIDEYDKNGLSKIKKPFFRTNNFYLIFNNDNKLETWGYLYEFKNSNSKKTINLLSQLKMA